MEGEEINTKIAKCIAMHQIVDCSLHPPLAVQWSSCCVTHVSLEHGTEAYARYLVS